MTETQNIINLLDSRLVEATRYFDKDNLRVRLQLANRLWVEYLEKWHYDTQADHFSANKLGLDNCIRRPDEWSELTQADEDILSAKTKELFPVLFTKELHTLKIDTDKGILGMLKELVEHGMLKKTVLVVFNKPTKIRVSKAKTKEVTSKKLYFFYSTNGYLCYSTKNRKIRSGFNVEDIIENIDRVIEVL